MVKIMKKRWEIKIDDNLTTKLFPKKEDNCLIEK